MEKIYGSPRYRGGSIGTFLRDIGAVYRRLSRQEEVELLVKARKGCVKSLHILAQSVLPLAVKMAIRMGYKLRYDDAASAACCGVMSAIKAHDPARGTRLTTTLLYHVFKEIIHDQHELGLIHVPAWFAKASPKATALLRRPLSLERDRRSWETTNPNSLDLAVVDGMLVAVDDADEANALEGMIRGAVSRLHDPRDRRIITLRFFEECTLRQCAEEFGVCRERIRQIQKRAIRRLRKSLTRRMRSARLLD